MKVLYIDYFLWKERACEVKKKLEEAKKNGIINDYIVPDQIPQNLEDIHFGIIHRVDNCRRATFENLKKSFKGIPFVYFTGGELSKCEKDLEKEFKCLVIERVSIEQIKKWPLGDFLQDLKQKKEPNFSIFRKFEELHDLCCQILSPFLPLDILMKGYQEVGEKIFEFDPEDEDDKVLMDYLSNLYNTVESIRTKQLKGLKGYPEELNNIFSSGSILDKTAEELKHINSNNAKEIIKKIDLESTIEELNELANLIKKEL